jgi:coenzyme Q-binding protein COQ10
MPQHQESRILPYTADQMYAVVADVEHYPDFLPWCSALIVESREKDPAGETVTAKMIVSYRGLNESYVSKVRLEPQRYAIDARHIEGPFKKLDTRWRFDPLPRGCQVQFLIEFAFKNPLLSAVANVAFGYVASRMAEAFIARAHALYG